ncbi:hypothetical protein [Ferruginibacter sp.]
MKPKNIITLIVTVLIVLVALSIGACHRNDFISVLRCTEQNNKLYVSMDSITIEPDFYVEKSGTVVAVVDFENLKDSMVLQNLSVTVRNTDKTGQPIEPDHISTVVHPVTISGGDLEHFETNTFKELSLQQRTITVGGSPYNNIRFYFDIPQFDKANFYTFKISGRLLYHNQWYSFEKEIKTIRKEEYHPYRMMT